MGRCTIGCTFFLYVYSNKGLAAIIRNLAGYRILGQYQGETAQYKCRIKEEFFHVNGFKCFTF